MFNIVLMAYLIEAENFVTGCPSVPVAWQVGELDAVVSQDSMLPIRNSLGQRFEKRHRRWPFSLLVELHVGQL